MNSEKAKEAVKAVETHHQAQFVEEGEAKEEENSERKEG